MTTANHAITGALIAVAVKEPALAIPLAFLSHFVLDSLPHFGRVADNVIDRNKHPMFRRIITTDAVLTPLLLVLLPILLQHVVSPTLVFACTFIAIVPDFGWIYRFYKETKTKQVKPGNWFSRFHKNIQWGERPWGVYIELIWFIGAAVLVRKVL